MMNIHEMSEKYAISVRKLRRLEKDGHLRVDSTETAIVSEMRSYLNKGNPLPAKHLLALFETPSIRLELGKQSPKADKELAALGDAKSQAAPYSLVAEIPGAAENVDESRDFLMQWLSRVLADHKKPVNHSWVAVRLLINCPENMRSQISPLIPKALLNIRKRREFVLHWRTEWIAGKNLTIYQCPAPISLDL